MAQVVATPLLDILRMNTAGRRTFRERSEATVEDVAGGAAGGVEAGGGGGGLCKTDSDNSRCRPTSRWVKARRA